MILCVGQPVREAHAGIADAELYLAGVGQHEIETQIWHASSAALRCITTTSASANNLSNIHVCHADAEPSLPGSTRKDDDTQVAPVARAALPVR